MSLSQHSQHDDGTEKVASHPIEHAHDPLASGVASGQTTPRAASPHSGSETETEPTGKKKRDKKDKNKKDKKKGRADKGKGKAREQDRRATSSEPPPPSPMLSTRAAASGRRHASKSRKSDDWSEVTDPEERRRIQNRIAQRKFREKAREQKERAERELRNQEHAGSSYQVPGPQDLDVGDELSGLPWGGPSLRHVVARGHESLSSQGSRRASDYMADDVAAAAYSAAGSRSSATAAAGSATSWTDSASAMGDSATASFYDYDNDYDDGSQLYSFPSGSSVEDSQPGSSRTSSDYAHLTDDKNSQYFGNSPYFYE